MPILSKRTISRYLTTQCKRQLRLDLSPENATYQPERDQAGMPNRQPPRPGITALREAGIEWEVAKYRDLQATYGSLGLLVYNPQLDGHGRTEPLALQPALANALPGRLLLETQFVVTEAFEQALAIRAYRTHYSPKLDYSELRPDIIQVLPSRVHSPGVHNQHAVTAGGFFVPLADNDARLRLRVIDIKHTAEPSVGYFAEVAYYMMALAGWLIEQRLDDRYVVVAGAVWPGSHDASVLRKRHQEAISNGRLPSREELDLALEDDLEPAEFPVFALRLRRFFQEELAEVLAISWRDLPYHVATVCSHCEYLGYAWTNRTQVHPDHCIPTAEIAHDLCRITDLSAGVRHELHEAGVASVPALALMQPQAPVFDRHQNLRAKRSIMPARARALINGNAELPTNVGTSSVMPRWSDLSIYLSVDFDVSSGITFAFGLRASWREPVPFGQQPTRRETWPAFEEDQRRPQAHHNIVDSRDIAVEERELLAFLERIQAIIDAVRGFDQANAAGLTSSMQIYLWDTLQYKHLQRVIGRHLPAILARPRIAGLPWLFPPEDVMPSHEIQRPSPITIIREAVAGLTALPVAHYYSLLSTAEVYHRDDTDPAWFNVHPLFKGALSDQIPSERAHEIWTRSVDPDRPWHVQLDTYKETVTKKLRALEEVTIKLQQDLGTQLREKAPAVAGRRIGPADPQGVMSLDGELWYAFAKLDTRIDELDKLAVRSMPAHEREAKFHSVLLDQQLTGHAEIDELRRLNLRNLPNRRVYRVSANSVAAKIAPGDFLFALSAQQEGSFLNNNFDYFTRNHPSLQGVFQNPRTKMEEATQITVQAFDRDRLTMVVDIALVNGRNLVNELEAAGLADFRQRVSVDAVSRDFFTAKLRACLRAIGNPAVATRNSAVALALGQTNRRGARRSPHTPAADFLWDVQAMVGSTATRLPSESAVLQQAKDTLRSNGYPLTPTQWLAWEAALTKRLQVIWGPPGTGKSQTLRAIIAGALHLAKTRDQGFRVLVCAFTYRAVDNVLLDLSEYLMRNLPDVSPAVRRLRSKYRTDPDDARARRIDLPMRSQSQPLLDLIHRLQSATGLTVVGATPSQVYNLLRESGALPGELFDMVVIDEASQMDVANAILPLCSMAAGGSLVLAGDPLQLPPIHQAEPPLGLEAMVGSIYEYITVQQGVTASMLDVNYRSCQTVVDIGYEAGYGLDLKSFSPDLRLNLLPPASDAQPSSWPPDLYWTPLWEEMMRPDWPTVCFIYADGRSSQWNDFEVSTIAALIQTVYGRVASSLANDCSRIGQSAGAVPIPYQADEFWQLGIGVVTPHRAQQSRIVTRLKSMFAGTVGNPALINGAVDTVERFQGQQRDIILASYALGDPDAIRDEEEFLMSLNRFNVMASRARAKLILLVSKDVIDYLAGDLDVLRESRLLKAFAESYCINANQQELAYFDQAGTLRRRPGVLRYR